jgi:hypothetical protein
MPLRIILEALAVGASVLSVLLAYVQVEQDQMSELVLWLASGVLLIAVVVETYDLVQVILAPH